MALRKHFPRTVTGGTLMPPSIPPPEARPIHWRRCMLYEPRCLLHRRRCTLCGRRCPLYGRRRVLYPQRCVLYGLRCPFHRWRCVLYQLRCLLHRRRYVLYRLTSPSCRRTGNIANYKPGTAFGYDSTLSLCDGPQPLMKLSATCNHSYASMNRLTSLAQRSRLMRKQFWSWKIEFGVRWQA
jgi:hypothetical protein